MKFMNLKRFGATIMAGVLALSMAVPAFAADTTPTGQVTITGSYQDIPISVSVPTTGTAQINPYGLPVNFALSDTISNVSVSGQQITSIPLSIRNQGTSKLSVNATLAVLPTGEEVSIKGGDLASSDKGKEINVKLQVAGLNDTKYAVSSLDTDLEDNIIKAFAADATWTGAKELVAPTAAAKATTVTPAKSATAMAALGAATVEDGGLITYGKDSIAVFRLAGELRESPVKGATGSETDNPWADADGFSATVVFKFKPYKEANLKVTPTTLALKNTSVGGTGANIGTVKATYTPGDDGLTVAASGGYSWALNDGTTGLQLSGQTTDTVTVTAASGTSTTTSATLTCTVTLSDGSTKTITCPVTYQNS